MPSVLAAVVTDSILTCNSYLSLGKEITVGITLIKSFEAVRSTEQGLPYGAQTNPTSSTPQLLMGIHQLLVEVVVPKEKLGRFGL